MKSILKTIGVIVVIMFTLNINAFASSIRIEVNGDLVNLEQGVLVDNGNVLIPLRSVYKSEKYDIEQGQDITIRRGFGYAKFFVDDNRVVINDREEYLDTCTQFVGKRIYIPLEALQSAVNNKMYWDRDENLVRITENPEYITGEAYELDFNQEILAKKLAMNFYNTNLKYIEKAIIHGDECYVFANYGDKYNFVAVERECRRIYSMNRKNDMYVKICKEYDVDTV
ncbi:MAG: hypothetical protein J6Y29_03470 [Clostridiales bacterium]|nr:hypothetical protein [Clostridiales bacterium]